VVHALVLGVFALLAALGSAGCAGGFASDRSMKIEEAAHLFADSLRFGKVKLAASFVPDEKRPDFEAFFKELAEGELRFTSIDVVRVDVAPGAETAVVELAVRLYRLPSVSEVAFVDEQQWHFDREAVAWRVEPDLALYENAGR
jgi:hypothetical protein